MGSTAPRALDCAFLDCTTAPDLPQTNGSFLNLATTAPRQNNGSCGVPQRLPSTRSTPRP
eukprot:3794495-Lingulodinium_polyedra.AAC.1